MRAREDLEARDNRKIAKEMNSGTRTGNKVYKTFFFQTKKKRKIYSKLQFAMGDMEALTRLNGNRS